MRPVFWHQGLLLQPQHFQLAERSLQTMLAPWQELLVPHFWGVSRLALRLSFSAQRSLEVAAGAFLFPDGTYLEYPGDAVIEPRGIDERSCPGPGPFTVYLGLRKWNSNAANVTVLEQGAPLHGVTTRFAAPPDASPCPDLHSGGAQGEVRQMSFVLKFFLPHEIEHQADYLLLPVARIGRKPDGLELLPDFIPPCLGLTASPLLFELVQQIADQLAACSRRLEEAKRQRGIQFAEFGSKDMVYLLALRTLNRYLAQLRHLLEAGSVHPWEVYGVLRQLVAELSSFSEEVTALGENSADGARLLPEYDHMEIGSCFSTAHDLILKLLAQVTAGPEYALPLHFDGTYFASELLPAHLAGGSRFYLVLNTEQDPKLVVSAVATSAKLSARERLPLLVSQALPGIPIEHLPAPPQELPRRASSVYFSIDNHAEQWELVQKWNNISLSWDQAPADLRVEVMIVARS